MTNRGGISLIFCSMSNVLLGSMSNVLLVKPQTDSPVEGGGAEELIDLLWLRV